MKQHFFMARPFHNLQSIFANPVLSMQKQAARILFILLLSGMAGCAITPKPTIFYDLRSETVVSFNTPSRLPSVGLRSVELPELLDRPGIVSYLDDHRVEISNQHVWAGQIKQQTISIISDRLAQRLNHNRVLTYPWPPAQRPYYQLRLTIDRLVGSLAGDVTLQSHWTLYADDGKQLLKEGTSHYAMQVEQPDYGSYVAAINQTINLFSDALAQGIIAYNQKKPPAVTLPKF